MARKPATANARGVATLDVGDRKVKLRLTLGALADIEDEFGIDSLDDLPLSAKAILRVIVRFAKAAGDEVSNDELRDADIDLSTVMETLRALGGGGAPAANPQTPSP